MIFIKWCTDYPSQDLLNRTYNGTWGPADKGFGPCWNGTQMAMCKGTAGAPVLLNEMIFMVLPGGVPNNLYPHQSVTQTTLVVIAIIMIPIMMCLKPCYSKPPAWCFSIFGCCPRCQELGGAPVKVHHHAQEEDSESERFIPDEPRGGGHGEDDFGEMMVHQILETIEFVLGSVSHTASYLRLWALSLAHSELATVFWDKIQFYIGMELALETGNWFVVGLAQWAMFTVWLFITFLVMMFMEGLSAFLHALRLHWVEFQSKFYKGDGHEFQPFSYKTLENPPE
jgi:V-type H+-transporting ATPase subunit a